jgi:hypothetical protein
MLCRWLQLSRKALLYGHRHHKPIMKLDAEAALLPKMTLDVPAPDCCGTAGAFDFEKGDKYDVLVACGERACCRRCARPTQTR